MNIALIFAGGTGNRINSGTKPKQFIRLHGKEIIIHTIENFECHSEIDSIVVVCIESWIPFFNILIKKFGLKKIQGVVSGGETGQKSIYNGLIAISRLYPEDSIVLINDGVRPLLDADLISRCIYSVNKNGSAITVTPAIETIITLGTEFKIDSIIDRTKCFTAKAPQCFFLKDILYCHKKAIDDGLFDFIDSATLLNHYGYDLYPVFGNYTNIKITTSTDLNIFRVLYKVKENS
jgi:2-C-methyl-D-erythritol 4-phosphate cytidylyltransferase